MSAWTSDELAEIDRAEEVEVTPLAPGGAPGRATTIWAVAAGEKVYVRSVKGRRGQWYRHAVESGRGRLRAGAVDREVAFVPADADEIAEATEAYRTAYASQPRQFLDPMVEGESVEATLRVEPV